MSSKLYCFKIGKDCPHEIEEDPKLVFVLMPFACEFDAVYLQGIKPAWESKDVGMVCVRADELFHTRDIMCQVCQSIQRARFVVADLTGRNPNVFYELGLAHAFAKEVILVTQDMDDVPFDLRPMRIVQYAADASGLGKLATELRKTAKGLRAQSPSSRPAIGATPEEFKRQMRFPANSYISEKDGKEMILIPAGEFIMGSDSGGDDEKPQRKRYLPDFYISRYPVTNAEFEAFVKATSYMTVAEKEGDDDDRRHPRGPDSGIAGRERHPVARVSWHDAVSYCQWAGKRLPNEAEWEKAARGSDGRTWPWGNWWVDGNCNTQEAGVGDTTPVGRYSPASDSPYGVADMAGNVWEWTGDWYNAYPGSTCKSDLFGERYRVLRGGSWFDDQRHARCACRTVGVPAIPLSCIGFRVVVSLADADF